jgi:hypothetical protein
MRHGVPASCFPPTGARQTRRSSEISLACLCRADLRCTVQQHFTWEEEKMSDTVRKVHYFSTSVPDKPGQTFKVLASLVSGGVNLLACTGTTHGKRALIDVVPDDTRKFASAARKAGLLFSEKKAGFMIQGDDRPGALADHLKTLAEAGINVVAVDGLSAGSGRWGAIVWVGEKDVRRAGTLLRAKAS